MTRKTKRRLIFATMLSAALRRASASRAWVRGFASKPPAGALGKAAREADAAEAVVESVVSRASRVTMARGGSRCGVVIAVALHVLHLA